MGSKKKVRQKKESLSDLINEYKTLPSICAKIDYTNEETVTANNKAVRRMNRIVERINKDYGVKATLEFQKLLDIEESQVNVWAAMHLLEILNIEDENIVDKALIIIEDCSNGNSKLTLESKLWLENWYE